MIALLGGQVDALASGPATVVQHIKAGKLRALAHWGDRPLAALPDVPSLKELGYAAQFAQWSALFVPAGTPERSSQTARRRPEDRRTTRSAADHRCAPAARSTTSMRRSSRPTGIAMPR